MKASVKVGSATEQAHYQKLLRDYDRLPPELRKGVDEMREEYKHIGFTPAPSVALVWDTFWAIRATKTIESPINHTDIYSYSRLLRVGLEIWEVRAVLQFDRAYNAAYSKYHE